MRRLAPLILLAVLAGCAATTSSESTVFDPGPVRISGPPSHRAQVLRDVGAMIEGMEGARLSRMRRAGS